MLCLSLQVTFNVIFGMQADEALQEAANVQNESKEATPHGFSDSSKDRLQTKEGSLTKQTIPPDSPLQLQFSANTSKSSHSHGVPSARGLSFPTTSTASGSTTTPTQAGTATTALNTEATPDPSAGPVATFSELHKGCKAAEEGVPCMLEEVATRDSVSDYATQSAAPMEELPPDATVQERKEYLEEQLDRLTNKVLGDYLLVLPGTQNRLAGGALPLKCTWSPAAWPYLYATGVLHDARPFTLL
jgi:hypothetical protein